MSGFLKNILARHINVTENVKPYIPGKFEPVSRRFSDFSSKFEIDSFREDKPQTGNIYTDSSTGSSQPLSYPQPQSPSQIKVTRKRKEDEPGFVKKDPIIKKSGEPGLFKEKGDIQKVKVANSINSDEIKSINKSFIKPVSGSPKNQKSSIRPIVPNDNFAMEKDQPLKGREGQANNQHSLKVEQSHDFRLEPTNVVSGIKKSQQEYEGDTNPGILFSQKTDLPAWLKGWKNEVANNPTNLESMPATKPTIKVNIGRIEVRAIVKPNSPPSQRKNTLKPKMSLDDYLKKRDGGTR